MQHHAYAYEQQLSTPTEIRWWAVRKLQVAYQQFKNELV